MLTTLLRDGCLSLMVLALVACGGGGSGDPVDPGSPPILSDPTTPSTGLPDETPGGTPDETPGGTPDETPGGTPDETPGGTPDETPGGTPVETPGGTPDETPGGTPDETPGGTPDETPGGTPDETPGGTPDEMPGGTPDETPGEAPGDRLPPDAASAAYSVTVQSLWFAEQYPQDFPQTPRDNAHLSLIGGATHNAAVSFWEPGTTPSRGIEDMAESGRIDIFLEEDVRPAIADGTADSTIEFREFTFSSPSTIARGLPTEKTFDIEIRRDWPRVTLVTMLGPSPDWFVGVDGLPLHEDGAWRESVTLELPLYDAGTKEGLSPFMGGIDIRPKGTIELIAYDAVTGTYGPSETPQTLARMIFTRTR